jgi:hypothetical protein
VSRRRRGDPAPADHAPVVVVAVGGPPSRSTIRRAVAEAAGGTVAVVALLRIHGSAWGFPNPGLLPNATEKAEGRRVVEATIAAIERHGGQADGQITATRNDAKIVVATARRRHARLVIVERPPAGRVRTLIEGDLGAGVHRRLRSDPDVTVEVVDHAPSTSAVRIRPVRKPVPERPS